jgi:hypothetical protein
MLEERPSGTSQDKWLCWPITSCHKSTAQGGVVGEASVIAFAAGDRLRSIAVARKSTVIQELLQLASFPRSTRFLLFSSSARSSIEEASPSVFKRQPVMLTNVSMELLATKYNSTVLVVVAEFLCSHNASRSRPTFDLYCHDFPIHYPM